MEVKNNQFNLNEDLVKNSNNVIKKANDLRKNSSNNFDPAKNEAFINNDSTKTHKMTKVNIKDQNDFLMKNDNNNNNNNNNDNNIFCENENLIKQIDVDIEKENLSKTNTNLSNNVKIHENNKNYLPATIESKILLLQNQKETNESNNYATFNNSNLNQRSYEVSIEINENTTTFDLYKGLIYMFFSCIFKSLFSILSKYTLKDKRDLSSFQLLTYRTYFMMWISIVVSFALPINVFSQKFAKLDKLIPVFFRTIFAIISMSLVIYSIKFMHVSDVYSVYYIYPAFVILFSLFFLKEKVGFFDILCLIACFAGAILIVKPDFIFYNTSATPTQNTTHTHNSFYFLLVVLAALLKAVEDVIIRNVGKEVNFLIFPYMYSVLGMILFPIPMFLFDSVYPSFSFFDVVVIFLIGLCTFLYMSFMALGFQNESAGRVSMVNYFQVALMYISDLCLFDKKLQLLDLIGTCLIFGFNFTNGLMKALKRMNSLERVRMKSNNNANSKEDVVEK